MPIQVKRSASYTWQIAAAALVLLQLVIALPVTVVHNANSVLWVPSLVLGVVLAAVFAAVRQWKKGKIVWRGVGVLLALVVAAAVALFAYAMFGYGNFYEAMAGWTQITLGYVYTIVLCLLPATVTAAVLGDAWDVWALRLLSAFSAGLTLYLYVYEYYYVRALLHSESPEVWQYLLIALSLLLCGVSWLLPMRKAAEE